MSAVADKLREARSMIERRGWCQGDFEDSEGRLCVSGALSRAQGNFGLNHIARKFIIRAINEPLIFAWNDAPGRTQSDVLAALDKAIELAESEQ